MQAKRPFRQDRVKPMHHTPSQQRHKNHNPTSDIHARGKKKEKLRQRASLVGLDANYPLFSQVFQSGVGVFCSS